MRMYTTCHVSPNKQSFRGPGDVARALDSVTMPKSVRGNWPLWSPVVSWGLPWPPVDDGTGKPKIQINYFWTLFVFFDGRKDD